MLLTLKIKKQRVKMNALSIFEKHLGNSFALNEQKNLTKNIKNINEAIGSLQTIDGTLKNAIKHLDDFETFASNSQCVFMGENLINKEITLLLFGETRSFFLQNFSTLLLEYSKEELGHYFAQKREEIALILDWVMEEMEQTSNHNAFTPSSHYSVGQNFYKL